MRWRLPRLRRRGRGPAAPVPAATTALPVFEPAPTFTPYAAVPQARESVELVFRDGTRVQLPEVEAAAFQELAGGLAKRDGTLDDKH